MKKATEEEGWRRLLTLCDRAEKEERYDELFSLFLTLEEKEALALRYLIVKALLKEKRPQREIAEVLRVSISKITRGSNALKIASDDLKEFLKTHM